MPRSMTTFARIECGAENRSIFMELRSLNSRFCDINLRISPVFAPLEEKIKKKIKQAFLRGKIDLFVRLDGMEIPPPVFEADLELAKSYMDAARKLSRALNLEGEIRLYDLLFFLKDAIRVTQAEMDPEEIWPDMERCLDALFEKALSMAKHEGQHLIDDLFFRLSLIQEHAKAVEKRSAEHVKQIKIQLRERAKMITQEVPVDEGRIAQEMMFISDRMDITEELVRLQSHIQQFKKYMDEEGAVGRRLDFLIQEMFREANTISSKSSDANISHIVVEIKSELEKMREQVQNIV